MPKGLKIVVAAVCAIIGVVAIALVGLRDLARRPDYCAQCHVMAPYVASWVDSDYLAYNHAIFAIACQECHEWNVSGLVREVTNTISHNYQEPLPPRSFPNEACTRCHGDYDQLAKRTQDFPRNPHASPHGQMNCQDCHRMHAPSVDQCAACHDPIIAKAGWVSAPKQ